MLRFHFSILLIIALWSCNRPYASTDKEVKFKFVAIDIPKNGVLNIQDCSKWYIDFSRIKRALIYKDKVICVGLNGGFACLNSSDLRPDTTLENLMNTDFFTDASVYHDTLFAEKFGTLYFWTSTKWTEYRHKQSINYFDLLFEDNQYAFYSSCMGEFGSILFVFNKRTHITRAQFTSCPNSVVSTDSGYFIGTHLYHMAGSSHAYTIRDIEKLKVVPDSIRLYEGMFDRDRRLAFLRDTTEELKSNIQALTFFYPSEIMIVSSFGLNGELYHIIHPREYPQEKGKRFIGTVQNDTLRIVDSLRDCTAEMARQFENTTIVTEGNYGSGFSLIRNDTMFNITFTTKHPGRISS